MPDTQQQKFPVNQALSLIETAAKAAAAYDRDDLVKRLRFTHERVADPSIRVLVVGEFKQGKSSLVNSLVRSNVCPVDDDIATATPMVLRHGSEVTATLVLAPEQGAGVDGDERRRPIDVADIERYVAEQRAGHVEPIEMIDVTLPSPALEGGITFVDTPGVGGLGSPYTAVTVAALPLADALVFVTDASQEFTKPEADFLKMARGMCPNMVVALTKRDLYPRWREIAERDSEILDTLGVGAVITPVSAPLHAKAIELGDADLLGESGIEVLERHARTVVMQARKRMGQAVAADLLAVTSQFETRFETEREALTDPAAGQRLVDRLEEAKERANQLRSDASRWQHTLQDGIADLNADVDTDLRGGIRLLTREAEDAIDNLDPADTWDEFESWLRARVMQAVTSVYARMHQQSEALSLQVGQHFQSAEDEFEEVFQGHPPPDSLDTTRVERKQTEATLGRVEKGLFAMRSSYGGVLMFGMLSGFVGLSMVNPASVLIGVLMGRKALRDERKRRMVQRQSQAKTAARRYLDDVQFHSTTDLRAALRRLQRQLRDWYGTRAEEHQRSSQAALAGIQEAMKKDAAERTARLRDVNAELDRIHVLRNKVDAYARLAAGKKVTG